MLFQTALLLSSKGEAEMIVRDPGLFRGCVEKPLYRLSLSQIGSNYNFAVQHATYPNRQEGQGWGVPVYSEIYHCMSLDSLDKIEAHLKAHDLSSENWSPAEDDED